MAKHKSLKSVLLLVIVVCIASYVYVNSLDMLAPGDQDVNDDIDYKL